MSDSKSSTVTEPQWVTCKCPAKGCFRTLRFLSTAVLFRYDACQLEYGAHQLFARSLPSSGPGALANGSPNSEPAEETTHVGMTALLAKSASHTADRDPQCIKHCSISSFHCKLISPFLTEYGIDRADHDRPVSWTELYHRQQPRAPPSFSSAPEPEKTKTFDISLLKDVSFQLHNEDLCAIGFGIDHTGSFKYLQPVLSRVEEHPANGS